MANIILVTHWTGGDVFPFIRLGNILSRNHVVTIFTHICYKNIAIENHLNFVAIDTLEEYEEMNQDLHMLANPIKDKHATIQFNKKHHGANRLIREYGSIYPYCNKNNTIILARHRSSISALLVAEKLEIPFASVVLAPNYLDHIELHNQVFGKEMVEEINKARIELNLNPILDWKDWLYSPKRFLGMWPDWFASPNADWPTTLVPIGFMENKVTNYNDFSDEVNQVLESDQQVVLITGGTTKMVSLDFYEIASKACVLAGYKGILVTKFDELVPAPLPNGIIREKEVNLSFLMTKVDAIIHHGGMGTLNEAILAGIPQIILPHLTDGPDNAFRLQKLNLAKSFPISRWNYFDIANHLKDAMSNENKNLKLYANKLKILYMQKEFISVIDEMINSPQFVVHYSSQNKIVDKIGSSSDILEKINKLSYEQKKYLLSKLK